MAQFTQDFYQSIKDELFTNILPYWEKYSRDTVNRGFFGHIDNDNNCNTACERSIVMTSRFLWTYSAVARYTKNANFLEMADFAYDVIVNKFVDTKNRGVYWSVLPDGTPKVSKKQIYGEAFCCYGLSEYAAAVKELRENNNTEGEASPSLQPGSQSSTNPSAGDTPATPPETLSEQAMNLALELYNLMETYAKDSQDGGYVEARAIDWKPTKDMILSPKDMNCPKSMNTNLHVMEAFTNLYRTLPVVFSDAKAIRQEVGESLRDLIFVTKDFILQPNAHLGMFFDMSWKLLDDEISYGHDIEASWLLWEAAEELNQKDVMEAVRDTVIKVAEVALDEGFDQTNGCMENFLKDQGTLRDRRRVWWNQAEAMNGFYNAWEMTGQEKYQKACIQQWNWIQNHQVDKNGGEWWNELDQDGNPILSESKGGNWKTSYHNGRTCLELLRRSGN
ncbi:MAG: AGE family epimerase/isomerase [Treponema sp.]|nr:AGE family epimerase/isomerase [Treponema sp.]